MTYVAFSLFHMGNPGLTDISHLNSPSYAAGLFVPQYNYNTPQEFKAFQDKNSLRADRSAV